MVLDSGSIYRCFFVLFFLDLNFEFFFLACLSFCFFIFSTDCR